MSTNLGRHNLNQSVDGFGHFLRTLALVVCYVAIGRFFFLAGPPTTLLIWPASGLALALLILWGTAYWPGVLLGSFALYFWVGGALWPNSGLLAIGGVALGNTAAAVIGAKLIQRRSVFHQQLDRPADVLSLVGYGALLATLVGAVIGVLILAFTGSLETAKVSQVLLRWWLGAATDVVVVAPVILSFVGWHGLERRAILFRLPVLMVVTLGISALVFFQTDQLPVSFLVFPCIFYACHQFGTKGASMVTLLIALMAVLGYVRGLGPFAADPAESGVLLLATFILFCALSSLFMTALLSARHRESGAGEEKEEAIGSDAGATSLGTREQGDEKFQALLESAPDAILIMDARSRVIQANQATETLFGYDRQSLSSSPFNLLFPERFGDKVRTHVGALLAKPDRELAGDSFELVGSSKDGCPLNLEVQFGSFEVGTQIRIACFIRDLTQRRVQEEKRQQLESKRSETQKRESLSLLAGGIAHDFNNLLMGILGNASIVLEDLPAGSEQRTYVERIQTAGMRSGELTRQLLAYAGKGTLLLEPVNLSRLVEDMTQQLKIALSSGGNLELDLAEELPAIRGDATQLRQVIMNLVSNASDALTGGLGQILLRTGMRVYNREALEMCYLADESKPGRYVFLEIFDQGTGMDLRTQAKIFDPFFTTKITGRGLGLAAVQGIVKGHGGAIKLESRVGQGTTLRLLFPIVSQEGSVENQARVKNSYWRGSGNVLVIDDEEFVLHFTSDTLKRYGFEPILAKDGDEGIRIFEEFSEEIRLVLLDMTMPGKSGEEVYEEIHQMNPNVPIVLSSGHSEQDALDHFKGKTLAGYLQKPYGVKVLGDLLRSLLS